MVMPSGFPRKERVQGRHPTSSAFDRGRGQAHAPRPGVLMRHKVQLRNSGFRPVSQCVSDQPTRNGEGSVMKTCFTVALSILAGAVLGAGAIQGLQAQGKPKAYTVSELERLIPRPKLPSPLKPRLHSRPPVLVR